MSKTIQRMYLDKLPIIDKDKKTRKQKGLMEFLYQ